MTERYDMEEPGGRPAGDQPGERLLAGITDIAAREGRFAALTSEQLDDLATGIPGPLLRAGDEGWDDALTVWNGMVAKGPALVLQPISAHDVAVAVGFARDHELLLSIKGGGHNIAGTSIAERGLMLDMSRMREVTVDPDARVAHVGPGCLLSDVDRATQEHGLATVLGLVSVTGVAGLTLGGGFGYLTRRFGWAVDNLADVQIVTADGEIRTASRAENPELFRALRGGGGNFGVVTRFTFRLHEVGPTITGGLLVWGADRAGEVLKTFRDVTESAPRELTAAVFVSLAPPAPFLPSSGTASRSSGGSCVIAAPTRRRTSRLFARSRPRSWTWSPRCPTPTCSRCSIPTCPKDCTTTRRPSSCPACRAVSSKPSAAAP